MFQCTDFPGFLICHCRLCLQFRNEESLLLQFVSGIYQIDCTINIEALLCLFDLDPVVQGQICLCQTILRMRFPISTLYVLRLSDPYFKSYTLFFEIIKLNFEMAAILNLNLIIQSDFLEHRLFLISRSMGTFEQIFGAFVRPVTVQLIYRANSPHYLSFL